MMASSRAGPVPSLPVRTSLAAGGAPGGGTAGPGAGCVDGEEGTDGRMPAGVKRSMSKRDLQA